MAKIHRVNAEDFVGKTFVNVLALSNGGKKRLQVATFVYEGKESEVIFQVTHSLGSVKERTSGYDTLEDAVEIYNMAWAG